MTEKGLVVVEAQADAPAEWRTREEIDALATRIGTMLPGKPDPEAALLLAQYSGALDANPFRGEIYAFRDNKGKLIFTEGYKLLVRWARRQCNFYDRYERLSGDDIPAGAIGYRCWMLREDAKPMITMFTDLGATWAEAYEIAAQQAIGVVTTADMRSKSGYDIPPPKGWTWDQVARKRAMKNAINLAYGAPSPSEIAAGAFMAMAADEESPPDDRDQALPAEPETRGRGKLFKDTAGFLERQANRLERKQAEEPGRVMVEAKTPSEPAEDDDQDDVFTCRECGKALTEYKANGKTWSVSQLVDIGSGLGDKAGILCGPCMKALKETLQ